MGLLFVLERVIFLYYLPETETAYLYINILRKVPNRIKSHYRDTSAFASLALFLLL
jgi:hypothetical protein